MSNNYVKLPNQGSIEQNLRLLIAMQESTGYADANGYFSKRAVAEIGVNATIITSGGQFGDDILDIVNDTETTETDNAVLQNAKQRMQLLRCLGLVSADYDSEQYAITDLGKKVLEQSFPDSANVAPSFALLLESFIRMNTSSEVYEYNCDLTFNSYLGFEVCYALANLDHRLSVQELPFLTTYTIDEIDDFVKLVKEYRRKSERIPASHPHFPRTQQGKPLRQVTNITRVITQILRKCEILELDNRTINRVNYYTCTRKGETYVDEIARSRRTLRFWTSYDFRKQKLLMQKSIAHSGYSNMLSRGGFQTNSTDTRTFFSPYQVIPECNVQWLFGEEIRKPPENREERIIQIEAEYSVTTAKLKPQYFSEAQYAEYIRTHVSVDGLIDEIVSSRDSGGDQTNLVEELVERYKFATKDQFYPFVHSLFSAMGLDCRGEVGRIDCLLRYDDIDIPCEIKSFSETPNYNMKGARQAVENSIITYQPTASKSFASLLVGFEQPSSTIEISGFIEAVYCSWGIKLIALDLQSLVTMCVNSIWNEQRIDFDALLTKHGIIEEHVCQR